MASNLEFVTLSAAQQMHYSSDFCVLSKFHTKSAIPENYLKIRAPKFAWVALDNTRKRTTGNKLGGNETLLQARLQCFAILRAREWSMAGR
mmetsp:Transcript_20283/g.27556  ORF Transcript_20283/g.27556 Transcript_20283/m.27556 type:complete len:91 (+) Transcript_20283:182-454(+)